MRPVLRVIAVFLAPLLGCSSGEVDGKGGNGVEEVSEVGEHEFANRLAMESSPYLLQHAHNPVDWFPWGDEAFAKAKREDKAVFLSIGYSTCHWCHVMERESFENEEIAELMNRHFVSIKVDREERPDVDKIYMAAVQALSGRGGWPLSVFLTPDGRPFWGGTYFPPEDRFGRPGFKTVLTQLADLWTNRRKDALGGAERLTEHLSGLAGTSKGEPSGETLTEGFAQFSQRFDGRNGGFETAPKFPRCHSLSFLLRYHRRSGEARALSMVETTLEKMAAGGVYDHLGGGFHRYATDAVWLVPHFEKMLYDQALAARAYLEAYQVTGGELYADVARDIFRYVLRDMTDEKGGFYSAEDADSEGVEGKFYVWSHAELVELLGEEDGKLFARVYGAKEAGNFRDEATGEETGENILHLREPLTEALAARLAPMREKLFRVREDRIHPLKDDKILTDWNGLVISSLAYAGRTLGEDRMIQAARKAASFLLGTMTADGRLLHRYRGGDASIPGFLDDYAFLTYGLIELYEATFEDRWLGEAKRLAEEMQRLFWDGEGGGFFFTGEDGEKLISRTKEVYDGAVPSGNSVAALTLLRLGRLTGDLEMEARGRETIEAFGGHLERMAMGFPFLLMGLDFAVGPTQEIVLAGDPGDAALGEMRQTLYAGFLPRAVLALNPSGDVGVAARRLIPFLAGQKPVDGKATAYVCESYVCHQPVTELAELEKLLGGRR